ncbi:ankyrin repeat and death domain-containing protein 1B-like [Corticium candelabrum]|uniref:ankyrin repeat and death domain-containing protein 1B-like n=1 Tax=Corticium candelabrum TaxID=121492 RepID=UPI002E26186E|nr:ankyrin repeat and death domain-containing protein 1B-like [Corticium candelabrum]
MGTGSSSEALFDAVCAKDVRKASAALKKGADVNVVSKEKIRIRFCGLALCRPSALQVACADSSIELVNLLLEHQVNVNYQQDESEWTALHYACCRSHLSIVENLLSLGCDIESKDKNGYTPFLVACRLGRLPAVQHLIQSKCNKAATTNDGETALHVAGNVEVVDYLVSIGLNIEDRDENGYTPFLDACHSGRLPVVERLIQLKCNKAATTNGGETALHVAGNVEVVDYLLSIGLNIEDRDEGGETALHVAGNVEVVDYLVSIGLNIEDRDEVLLMAAQHF